MYFCFADQPPLEAVGRRAKVGGMSLNFNVNIRIARTLTALLATMSVAGSAVDEPSSVEYARPIAEQAGDGPPGKHEPLPQFLRSNVTRQGAIDMRDGPFIPTRSHIPLEIAYQRS